MVANPKSFPWFWIDEIARFLESVEGLRNRVALATAYAAGLRIIENSEPNFPKGSKAEIQN